MISIVSPNFNSGEKLVRNLLRLFELLNKSKLDFEVIVVDDASTDDSRQKLEDLRSKTKIKFQLISSEKNRGFGMTVDAGIRKAKGEMVFVLNAIDLLPHSSDYFTLMLEHFKDPKVFSVGALKRDTEDHGCGEIYFEKGYFLHRRKPVSNIQYPITSAWADGGSQALRKEYYLKIGGFDPLYKFYWEDVDLGYRAWKAGYRVDFEPKAVLIHQKSDGPIAKYYSERQMRIMNLRNQMIFTWKNADAKHLIYHLAFFIYHLAVAVKNRDGQWFRALFEAILQSSLNIVLPIA